MLKRLTLTAIITALLGAGTVPAEPQNLPTRIEIDQAKGEIVFVVDGRPAAQIVSSGIMVPGDIRYGGTMTDVRPGADAR